MKTRRSENALEIERGDIMRFVNGFLQKNKRQKITVLSALLIVYSIAAAGIFSYFHGSDKVSNRLSAENGSVAVTETEWNRTGRKFAAVSEPGMVIPKDPAAWNDGTIDIYVRLKLTVHFNNYVGNLSGSGNELTGELGIPSDERRNRGIFNALMINDEHLIDNVEEALDKWRCNNDDFVYVDMEQSLDSRNVEFYFYYTAGDKNGDYDDVMHCVKPGESTSLLFTTVNIPTYKHEYLGIFDQPYSINVQAEAVPASKYETAPKVDDIIADFR